MNPKIIDFTQHAKFLTRLVQGWLTESCEICYPAGSLSFLVPLVKAVVYPVGGRTCWIVALVLTMQIDIKQKGICSVNEYRTVMLMILSLFYSSMVFLKLTVEGTFCVWITVVNLFVTVECCRDALHSLIPLRLCPYTKRIASKFM